MGVHGGGRSPGHGPLQADGGTGRTHQQILSNMDGKVFQVADARRKVIEVLNVQNPEDLKVVQPWPKQTKRALAEFQQMTPQELTEQGLHIPPYHPHCRTICRVIGSSKGEEIKENPHAFRKKRRRFNR